LISFQNYLIYWIDEMKLPVSIEVIRKPGIVPVMRYCGLRLYKYRNNIHTSAVGFYVLPATEEDLKTYGEGTEHAREVIRTPEYITESEPPTS
jgi:hypothetical protein